MERYLLEARDIVKSFPGVKALDGVNLKIRPGEVHALVGENGAGKSTLMLTLGGIYQPESGTILLKGQPVEIGSAAEAQKLGIGVVYQELSVVPNLSIAENIFFNRQPTNSLGFVNSKKLNQMTKEMLSLFQMEQLPPQLLLKHLAPGNRQVIEILKVMSYQPKVLILDEPTSSLTEAEVKELFANIRLLKSQGIAFIYISHHLHEIFEIADRVTVLRDGKYICEALVKEIDEEFLVTKMVGRKLENIYGQRPVLEIPRETVFAVSNLTRKNVFKNITFNIGRGEIVGMAGLIGAGRTEIARTIFGADGANYQGEITLEEEVLHPKNPKEAIAAGIGYMSEDRKNQGLYIRASIKANLISNRLKSFSKRGFLSEKKILQRARKDIEEFSIATPSPEQLVGRLSGGNQQKVLLATWIGIKPKLLIVDEPTRGVDIGAKSEIYTLLRKLAAQGVAILMISSDLPEILGLSDRIIVIKNGAVSGILSGAGSNEEEIISLAAGSTIEEGGAHECH